MIYVSRPRRGSTPHRRSTCSPTTRVVRSPAVSYFIRNERSEYTLKEGPPRGFRAFCGARSSISLYTYIYIVQFHTAHHRISPVGSRTCHRFSVSGKFTILGMRNVRFTTAATAATRKTLPFKIHAPVFVNVRHLYGS